MGKLCSKCGAEKPPDHKHAYCKKCRSEYKKAYYQANKEKLTKQRLAWHARNKEKDRAYAFKWRQSNPDAYRKGWQSYNLRRRVNVLLKISKELRCCRCGCDKIELLEINHKYGGGLKEVGRRNQVFYQKIISGERATDDLEILCKPCNILHYLELKYGPLPYSLVWRIS
jgi:hypothetical protein